MKNQFMAGAAKAIITPPLGTKLYGYAFQRTATKVNDDLRVNAIAVEQGESKAILISADVVSIGEELFEKVLVVFVVFGGGVFSEYRAEGAVFPHTQHRVVGQVAEPRQGVEPRGAEIYSVFSVER